MSSKMKALSYNINGSKKLTLVELPIPEPKKGWVRIKNISCGICHTDILCGLICGDAKRIPGHEIIGRIDKMGEGVDLEKFKTGQMVGVGWFGGNHCGKCKSCMENEWIHCKQAYNCGLHIDGGYAEYTVVPEDALVIIPDGMDPIESSPLLCAGITVFNGLRNQYIKAGSLVCIQGIGGLGHLGIQFARKCGYETIAMGRGDSKKEMALKLGANHYIDTTQKDYIDKIKSIGSVKLIICTAPSADAVSGLVDCLGVNGKILVAAAFAEDFKASSLKLIDGSRSINGWASGDSRDSQDTIHFSQINNVKPWVKAVSIEQAADSLENIDKARFRFCISFSSESNSNKTKVNQSTSN